MNKPRSLPGIPILSPIVFLVAVLAGCTTPPAPPPPPALSPASPPTAAQAPVHALLPETDPVAAYYGGDLKASAAAYREVLEREPIDLAARRNLVQVLREAALPLEALEQLEMLLASRPDEDSLRLEAAKTALFAGEPERALATLGPLTVPLDVRSAPALYLSGLALMDLGRAAEAAEALSASLEQKSFNPMGWYWLGTLQYELGVLEPAETSLLEALSQDRNLTETFLPLARVYLSDGRVGKAYGLLRRAEASLPGNLKVRELLAELLAEHPELSSEAKAEQRRRRETAAPKRAESFPEAVVGSLPAVRIGLAEKVQELYLKTGGTTWLEPQADGGESSGGRAATVLLARGVDASVEVLDPDGVVIARAAGPLRLRYGDPADTTILFDVQFGQGSFWAGSEDRMYRGVIELVPHPEGLTVINELSIEEYLYSVLPSEMPSSWPTAALQAQAVAARSYTLANLGRFAARGFDLLGTVASAAYRGMGSENPAVRAAVDTTRGQVLTEQGKPLAAYYSANCGGYTESTEFVWGFASTLPAAQDLLLPGPVTPREPAELARWLADRPVTFSSHPDYANRSAYRWTQWVPRQEIEARLAQGDSLGSVVAITASRRGVSGRVPEVRIRGTAGDHTVRWDAIRWRLGGLRSNLFVVEPKLGRDGLPEYFVFTGAGWGHGVGMCQTGAAGMASVGFDAEAILSHYYGEAVLGKLY